MKERDMTAINHERQARSGILLINAGSSFDPVSDAVYLPPVELTEPGPSPAARHSAVDIGSHAGQQPPWLYGSIDRGVHVLRDPRGLTRTAVELTVFQLATPRVPEASHSLRRIGNYIRAAVSQDQRWARAA